MKKKKRGFTLTELIAVIAVLALIALISIPAYNSIKKRTLETQYKNTVTLIETAAEKYASKTGYSVAIVKELIDAGLIETDDGEAIYDPRNKKSLNCYPVEIEYKKGKYKATIIEKEVEGCSGESARSEYSDITIEIKGESGKDYSSSEWIGENVRLSVKFTEEVKESNLKYNWVTNSGQTSENKIMELSTANVFDGTVNVTVKGKENRYFTSTQLKIDKENPIIEDVEISGGSNWRKERVVKVQATDKNGSGIAGYNVSSSPCNERTIYKEVNEYKFTKDEINRNKPNKDTPATYYVCVRDKVGLVTSKEIKLDAIDREAPECIWSGESTTWTKANRTITLTCSDSISGCNTRYAKYETNFDRTTSTATLSYTIQDNSGNSTKCSKTVNVYVDKNAPTVPTITNPTNGTWTNSNFSLDLNSKDNESGIAYYQYTFNATATTTGTNNTTNWVTYNNSAKQNFTTTMFSTERNQAVYIRACDAVGNCSSKSNTMIKIDKTSPTVPTVRLVYEDGTSYNQSWTNRNVKQIQSSSDSGVGGIYYQYSHDNANWMSMPKDRIISFEGNWYFYVRACDSLGNCSSSASKYWIGIDKTKPSIWRTTMSNDSCKTTYKCSSGYNNCIEYEISDNVKNSRHLYVEYSLCADGYNNESKASCDYGGTNDAYSAKNRLEHYITYGSCKSPGDIYDGKCYKSWVKANNQHVIGSSSSKNGLCSSYSGYTMQYALRVCDSAGNCSGVVTTTN